ALPVQRAVGRILGDELREIQGVDSMRPPGRRARLTGRREREHEQRGVLHTSKYIRPMPDPPDAPTTPAGPSPPAAPSRALVRRHHWVVRLTHWVTVLTLAGLIASGLQIYEAYARFGNRGGPFFPSPFDDACFPAWSRLGGWLAGALNWHFALMWPLVTVGLLYLGYLVRNGEWRAVLCRSRDVRGAIAMTQYYLRLRKDHPPQGKHNPL